MKEARTLELKEKITNTFLKTVSAFANYDGGTIVFGIDDGGNPKGIDNPKEACLEIENKINDSISPQPDYTLSINEREKTISLDIKGGTKKPYLYKAKAYKRNATSTIEVDTLEFTRLVLEGRNLNFEELPNKEQGLTFTALEEALKKRTGIENFNSDILRTLNLYDSKQGYNNAAAILADDNEFPGIDIAKFGANINIINKRATFVNMSVLSEYTNAIEMYKDYYQYDEVRGSYRETVERIPEEAFREAIANALIHRTWDINANIRVFMFDDRIEVVSPGGLPKGITEEDYFSGRISVFRNPILAGVFYRLNMVEMFGTGVVKIIEVYAKSVRKPQFKVTPNSITVILPVIGPDIGMTNDENVVYDVLSRTMPMSISDITMLVDFGKSKTTELLKTMADKGVVNITGNGRGTKYRL